jgi:hypothetical protein
MAGRTRVQFQKNDHGKQQMRQNRRQNRAPAEAWPFRTEPNDAAPNLSFSCARAGQFWFGAAHDGVEWVLTKRKGDSVPGRVAE